MNNPAQIRRFILTGTPGSGKTSSIRELEKLGHAVIHEAATDVIAQEQAKGCDAPWEEPNFVDQITHMQKDRQMNATGDLQFYDRSPFCSLALLDYLFPPPKEPLLRQQIENKLTRLIHTKLFQPTVFFFEQLESIQYSPHYVKQQNFTQHIIQR